MCVLDINNTLLTNKLFKFKIITFQKVLVLAGAPHMRPPLVDLANLITKNNSLMVVGEVISVS